MIPENSAKDIIKLKIAEIVFLSSCVAVYLTLQFFCSLVSLLFMALSVNAPRNMSLDNEVAYWKGEASHYEEAAQWVGLAICQRAILKSVGDQSDLSVSMFLMYTILEGPCKTVVQYILSRPYKLSEHWPLTSTAFHSALFWWDLWNRSSVTNDIPVSTFTSFFCRVWKKISMKRLWRCFL